MLGRYRNSFAEVNLQVLEQNYLKLQQKAGSAGLAPMVKADAYGHGDVHVARICEKLGAKYLGVALIEEGIKLRQAGLHMPILVFGFFDAVGAEAMVRYRLTPVLSDFQQVEYLKAVLHDGASYPVHVKFNTGMQRLGFEMDEAPKVADYFVSENFLKLEGVCTHLVSSEHISEQEKSFQLVQQEIKKRLNVHFLTHLANTTGLFGDLKNKYNLVRPGISLYGIGKNVTPVLSLKSSVSMIRVVKKNQSVSYNATWKAAADSKIALVPLGYADGIPRALSNKGQVLISGKRCPIRGIICMDYFMVDVTHLSDVIIGDEAVIIGRQNNENILVTEVAEWAGTISYEILTGIQQRVPRIYIH